MANAVRRRRVLRQVRRKRDVAIHHIADRLPQPADILRVACTCTDDRNPQQDLQRMKIDPDSSCLRFIHQIDADDQLFTPRHQLKCKR